jgi:hypothetical protein
MIDSALCIKNTSICIMTRKAKSSYLPIAGRKHTGHGKRTGSVKN